MRTAFKPWPAAIVLAACCALPYPAAAQRPEPLAPAPEQVAPSQLVGHLHQRFDQPHEQFAQPHESVAQRDGQDARPRCREVRSLGALQYWFSDGYYGLVDVRDFADERWGRLAADPGVCIRIALVVVDDPEKKTSGYRDAITELLQWVPERRDDDDETARHALRQLERLTGEDFDTRTEWLEWWAASRNFVVWSAEEDHLVVIEEAQEAGAALHDDALILDGEEYWFYSGRGWISHTDIVGDLVVGTVVIPPHSFNFRAGADALDDRRAKGNGYRRALENLFVDGLLLPNIGNAQRDRLIGRIAAITGERPRNKDSWVAWWRANRDRLVLSRSGETLVVRR